MSRKKLYRILIEAVLAVLIIAALVFFVGFRVDKVQVEGNKFYTDAEIKKMVLDAPIAKNSLLAGFIKTEEKTKDALLIDHVTIKRKNRNTLLIQVKEKQMIGYFQFEGKCVNFDRQGMIQIITDTPIEDVPLIDGLDVKEAKQGETLKGINTKKLNTILSVGKMLEKSEQKPDRLVFNEMNQLVLYYGSIEVRLGNDENMDEKMNRLIGILPQLEGMEGILHLENITEDTESVVFDSALSITDGEDVQNTDGENLDADTDAGENGEDIEDTENGDNSSDGYAEDTNPSADGDNDAAESQDSGAEELDLDYSDGSDAEG